MTSSADERMNYWFIIVFCFKCMSDVYLASGVQLSKE